MKRLLRYPSIYYYLAVFMLGFVLHLAFAWLLEMWLRGFKNWLHLVVSL